MLKRGYDQQPVYITTVGPFVDDTARPSVRSVRKREEKRDSGERVLQ